ncbi:helix-turn-helix domain-containing protein [Turicibacter sanguinis]|uniref:helix-turn-helix domain-containing protein n=1 Tax=Turicibacter sanguinis TaxID=154288 RepID=UPI0018AB2E42|nr:helix-turn-helix transcriptional regulator [Turicibacter sanguinis]MDB8552871.1 helix-turn-helix transcriptional regulator [Turicibacter sanguinis]
MSFGDRVKQIRKEAKLNQENFAKRINLSRSNLSNIEIERVTLTDRVINDICSEFNINKEWLLTSEGEMYKPQPQIDELEYLMGKFSINAEEDEMRTKIIKALLKLDDNGWKVIEGLVDDILKETK